jgi:hypothetical protein
VIKYSIVVPNVFDFLVYTFLPVTVMVPEMLRWLLAFGIFFYPWYRLKQLTESGIHRICSEVLIVMLIPNEICYLLEILDKTGCYTEHLVLNMYS